MLKIIRDTRKANRQPTLSQFRDIVKEQFQFVLLDEERAIKALPKLSIPASLSPRRRSTPYGRSWQRRDRCSRRKKPASFGSRTCWA
jgi:hypothetical protein